MRMVVGSLLLVVGISVAYAAGGWVLWARTCDLKSQQCDGPWQRWQTYEAERWCRAARTSVINHALTDEARKAAARRGTVLEYQCFPETVDPRREQRTK
jgi:hypothetical protein